MRNEVKITKAHSFTKNLIINVLHVFTRILFGILKIFFVALTNSNKQRISPSTKEIWSDEKSPITGKYRTK
jgi:hypothetical protein